MNIPTIEFTILPTIYIIEPFRAQGLVLIILIGYIIHNP